MKRPKLPGVPAWAWKWDRYLCCWAAPDHRRLVEDHKPTDEAVPVRVRIVQVAELRALVERAGRAKT